MYDYLLYFLIFSFFGWCAEVIFYFLKTGEFVNRGLAKGPVCPIYGIGICLSSILLSSIDSFLLLVLFSMAVATIVEFLVGLFLDKVIGQRLWDYRGEKGNILGYVCPTFSLIWGIIAAMVIKLLPLLTPFVNLMKTPLGYAFAFVLSVAILVDVELQMVEMKKAKK